LVVSILVGLAAAFVILAHRFAAERAYHTVEITIDGDDWTTLARRNGMSREDLYAELYRRGARSVTLYAASLRRLSDGGLISFLSGTDALDRARTGSLGGPLADLVRAGRVHPDYTYVLGPPSVLGVIRRGFAIQLGASHIALLPGSAPVLQIGASGRDVEDASVGVVPEEVAAARQEHLAAEVRVRNFRDVTPDGLDAFFAGLRALGESFTMIFDRDQVLGYETLIPDVANQIKRSGFAFGQIEAFTARRRQKGEEALALAVRPNVIRVFSMTPEELQGSSPDEARDKFVLAARERNVRILYIRPFLSTSAGVNPISANLEYVEAIASDLTRAGYRLGKAAPLPSIGTPSVLFLLVALGTFCASALAVEEIGDAFSVRLSRRVLYAGVAGGMLITAGVLAIHHATLWRQLLALAAALAFPTLAMYWLVPGARRAPSSPTSSATPAPGQSGWSLLASGIGGLWAVSAVTALGAAMVGALLSEWLFMMAVRDFLGVKLAHIIPVVLIGLLIAAAAAPPGELWSQLRRWLRQPLLLEYGIAVIVVGVVVVFALGRTGNSGLPLLSGLELKSRVVLQHLLIARPRTKEYLIGDPFMVLTFALAATGLRRWVLPAAMIGAIGQVGLVNSFSHIHTPLVYALARTVYALVIGSILGAVLIGILWASRRRWAPVPARVPTPVRTPEPAARA
jgi:hypothetical protein